MTSSFDQLTIVLWAVSMVAIGTLGLVLGYIIGNGRRPRIIVVREPHRQAVAPRAPDPNTVLQMRRISL